MAEISFQKLSCKISLTLVASPFIQNRLLSTIKKLNIQIDDIKNTVKVPLILNKCLVIKEIPISSIKILTKLLCCLVISVRTQGKATDDLQLVKVHHIVYHLIKKTKRERKKKSYSTLFCDSNKDKLIMITKGTYIACNSVQFPNSDGISPQKLLL